MKNLFFSVMTIAYLAIGIVQWFATVAGFTYYFGFQHQVAAWIVASFLTYIPLVGSAAGIYGAHYMWGWDWGPAIALFGWWYALVLLFIAGSAIVERK